VREKVPLENCPEAEKVMLKLIARYIELLLSDFSPNTAIGKVKQLVSQIGKGVARGSFDWRKPLCRASSLVEQNDILNDYLDRVCRAAELSAA
jgi:tRNA-dihydrouridine synthase